MEQHLEKCPFNTGQTWYNYECLARAECEERCPYELPIRRLLWERADYLEALLEARLRG